MKIMEEGVVNNDDDEILQQGDTKDCDFGNYIQDEDYNTSPDYFGGYLEENQTLSNEKDRPRRVSNSVEALVRHFKIFFPKSKKSKHSVQLQPEVQQSGLRSFSFSDSKIGKEFEHFTMGHAVDFFNFDTEYIDDSAKSDTAPPLHYSKRPRFIGDESIFRNSGNQDNPDNQFNSLTSKDETETPFSQPQDDVEEVLPRVPSVEGTDQGRNEYLLPDDSDQSASEEVGHYQNFSDMNDEEVPVASDSTNESAYNMITDNFNETSNNFSGDFDASHDDPNIYNPSTSGQSQKAVFESDNVDQEAENHGSPYDYNQDVSDGDQGNMFESENVDEEDPYSTDNVDQEVANHGGPYDYNRDVSDDNQGNMFESENVGEEDPYSTESPHNIQSGSIERFRNSSYLQEDFDNLPVSTKSLPSLIEKIPLPPPIDPNRPLVRDEKLKVYRSAVDNPKDLKRGSSNFIGKAMRRISSYFSLKKEKPWNVDQDSGVELSKF